jgi:protein-disulfide isomerase
MENKPPVNKLVPILVVLLIVASFFIGTLYTRVKTLEKGTVAGAQNNGQVAGNNNVPTQPQEPAADAKVDIELKNTDQVLGNKNAKVAVVVYTDYQCPFCGRLATDALAQVRKEYVDTNKIKLIVRDFPLFQIHPYAEKAAEAANCAIEGGKFWEYHDKLFANQTALTVDDLKKYAASVGLNAANFNTCLDGGKYADAIKQSAAEGEKYGVRGTPASFVGTVSGSTVKGAINISGAQPFDSFKTAIDAALKT